MRIVRNVDLKKRLGECWARNQQKVTAMIAEYILLLQYIGKKNSYTLAGEVYMFLLIPLISADRTNYKGHLRYIQEQKYNE